MKKIIIVNSIIIPIIAIIFIYFGDITRWFNRVETSNVINILKIERVIRIAVSCRNCNTINFNFEKKSQKIILNKDSISVIVNGILNAKGYLYSHPLINCDFKIRLYFGHGGSVDCNVFNSSNNGTIFILYNSNGERGSSFRNDELNDIICEFLDAHNPSKSCLP